MILMFVGRSRTQAVDKPEAWVGAMFLLPGHPNEVSILTDHVHLPSAWCLMFDTYQMRTTYTQEVCLESDRGLLAYWQAYTVRSILSS